MTEQTFTEENKNFTIPEVIPILPLHNALVFPKMIIPLEVSGSNSTLVDEAMTKDRLIGLIMTKNEPGNPTNRYSIADLHNVGTCAVILKMAKLADNKTQILLQGMSRFSIQEIIDRPSINWRAFKYSKRRKLKILRQKR